VTPSTRSNQDFFKKKAKHVQEKTPEGVLNMKLKIRNFLDPPGLTPGASEYCLTKDSFTMGVSFVSTMAKTDDVIDCYEPVLTLEI
jgi:hypothetical protein